MRRRKVLLALTATTALLFAPLLLQIVDAQPTIVKIGVDLPMSGGERPNGAPTNNGVILAIEEANTAGGPYRFEEALKDDALNGIHDPAKGARNVLELIGDAAVVAIIGNFNSNVGRATIPITNVFGIVQISPSQTNPGLTKPEFGALQIRTADPTQINYFRVCTTTDMQGPVAADFAYKNLNARSVAILDDQAIYGKLVAGGFERQFAKLGGTVLSHDGIQKEAQDFHAILTRIKSENPDLLFFGGVTMTGGGLIRKQMSDVGLNIPYAGGDGLLEDEFLKVAGSAADGTYATVEALDAAQLPSMEDFVKAYRMRFNADVGAYSGNAYVAAKIIIDAVNAVGPDRAKIRAWVASLNQYHSIMGTFSFDSNGDTTNRIISIYVVKNGEWQWLEHRSPE